MMRKKMLAVGTWLLALMIMPGCADDSLICDDTTFDVEQGFVGVLRQTANDAIPFCVSDNPAVLTKTLSFRDQEVCDIASSII